MPERGDAIEEVNDKIKFGAADEADIAMLQALRGYPKSPSPVKPGVD